jgi:hypothetical protein
LPSWALLAQSAFFAASAESELFCFRSQVIDWLDGFERGVDLALQLEALFTLERQTAHAGARCEIDFVKIDHHDIGAERGFEVVIVDFMV